MDFYVKEQKQAEEAQGKPKAEKSAPPPQDNAEQVEPQPVSSSPKATSTRRLAPLVVVAILLMAIVVGLASVLLYESSSTDTPQASQPAPPSRPEPNPPSDRASEKEKPPQDAPRATPAKEPTRPAPGYNLVQTSDGSLSAEVPQSWGVETGEDSEKEGTSPGTWSYYAGEYLTSSITTARSLGAWYGGEGSSGAYFVASKALTQYSDYELTHALLSANQNQNCASTGPYEDYKRPPYSGKLQTWYDCPPDGATGYTMSVAPEGRECVVVLSARVSRQADREAIQHLVDTFKVDCGSVTGTKN